MPFFYLAVIVNLFARASCESCSSKGNTTFDVTHAGLREIPQIPNGTEFVCLRNNQIMKLQTSDFLHLPSCKYLNLGYNHVSEIQSGALNGLINLIDLQLDHNYITELRSDVFTGLDALEEINFNHNSISMVRQETLNGLRNLKQLWLAENSLTDITSGMFDGLHQLEDLAISQNKLKDIEIDSFSDLNNLKMLNLAHNDLIQLQNDVFNGLWSLSSLQLHGNKLTTIDSRVFDVFREVLTLSVSQKNPLVCDERLCWLLKRVQERRIIWNKYINEPKCDDETEWNQRTWHCPGNFI